MHSLITKIKRKSEKGFTLVETLIAIFILLLAITGPMTVAFQSVKYVRFAADRSVATMLAQDAMEYIIAKKNYNIATNGKDSWMDDLDPTAGAKPCRHDEKGCVIDTSEPLSAPFVDKCLNAGCDPLLHNGQYYGYTSGGTESRFTRTIYIETPGNNADERIIRVEVSYTSGVFTDTYVLRLNVFKSNV